MTAAEDGWVATAVADTEMGSPAQATVAPLEGAEAAGVEALEVAAVVGAVGQLVAAVNNWG